MFFHHEILQSLKEKGLITDDDIKEIMEDHQAKNIIKFWDKIHIGQDFFLDLHDKPRCTVISKDPQHSVIIAYGRWSPHSRRIRKGCRNKIIRVGVNVESSEFSNGSWLVMWYSIS